MTPSLSFRDVWKRYGDGDYVLRSVSLELQPGSIALVTGPNGSGKTTLIRLASGLLAPTRGSVKLFGQPARSLAARSLMGLVLHNPLLYPELTVEENLRYYAGLRGASGLGAAARAVELLGLKPYMRRKVSELSFGWRRRADIARALLGSPRVLLVDEVATGLDESARMGLLKLFSELAAGGGTVLMTSQEPVKAPAGTLTYRLRGGGVELV